MFQEELGIRNQFEVEVLSYGHLPLAYSARCFTARSEDRPKDECETCCIKYLNGRNVLSQENQQVFVLNGIQTMSGYVYNQPKKSVFRYVARPLARLVIKLSVCAEESPPNSGGINTFLV